MTEVEFHNGGMVTCKEKKKNVLTTHLTFPTSWPFCMSILTFLSFAANSEKLQTACVNLLYTVGSGSEYVNILWIETVFSAQSSAG